MDFSKPEKACVIIPKFTAFISFCCSFYIVQHILTKPKKRNSVYHRLLLGLSISDMIGSFGYFLSSWPMPHDADPPVYLASGTTATCTAQGFLQHGGNLSAPLYNGSMVTHNLLLVSFGISESRLREFEWVLHAMPLVIAWGTAIASVALDLYNPAGWLCWIAPLPEDCKQSFLYGDEGDCIRGDNYSIYRYAFLYFEVWATILYSLISMVIIYFSVLKIERKMDQYNFNGECNRSKSRGVFRQQAFYVAVFILTWAFASAFRAMQLVDYSANVELKILMSFFLPFQGFFNFLVYVRPRFLRYRQEHPSKSLTEIIQQRPPRCFRKGIFTASANSKTAVDSAGNNQMNSMSSAATCNANLTPKKCTGKQDANQKADSNNMSLSQKEAIQLLIKEEEMFSQFSELLE